MNPLKAKEMKSILMTINLLLLVAASMIAKPLVAPCIFIQVIRRGK